MTDSSHTSPQSPLKISSPKGALPQTIIICGRCEKFLSIEFFSKRQFLLNSTQKKKSVCINCVKVQVNARICAQCLYKKAVGMFSKSQLKKDERAVCIECVKRNENFSDGEVLSDEYIEDNALEFDSSKPHPFEKIQELPFVPRACLNEFLE